MKRFFLFLLAVSLILASEGTYAVSMPTITSFGVAGGDFLIEGEMTTFSWKSENASYCIADGDWSGSRDASGSYNLYITNIVGYARYQLVCYDSVGNRSSSAILTPFVGSSGFKKQQGSLAVVSAKTTSTDPNDATIVAELTQTPAAASIVLHEMTTGPADPAGKVSMFLPSTALTGSTIPFRFDGPAKPTAGKSYAYTITAQGTNATDVTTYSGTITIDVDFKVETVRVDTSTITGGERIETKKNVYVTFSRPAKNVKTQVSSMNEAGTALTNEYVKTYEYPSNLYQSDQKSFAAGTFSGLPRGRKFQYVVEGQERGSGKPGSYTGTFTTAPEIVASEVEITPSHTEAYITWKTSVPTGSAIEYYSTSSADTTFAFSEQAYPQTFHKVTVKDLKPDTAYKAMIHGYIHNDGETDTTKKTEPYSFRTKVASQDTIACTEVYDPVCGKDNKTYSNSCKAQSANASVAYKGECKPFKISSLRLDKLDALGKSAEDERSFAINTTDPFSKIVISLWEAPNTSITQTPYMTATVTGNGTLMSIYVSPGVFDKKLQPNKTYKYLVTAYKYGATEDLNMSVGDTFTTSDFAQKETDKSSPLKESKSGPITVSLTTPKTLVAPGSAVVLTWTVTNADTCTASGGWSGSKNPSSGSETVYPTSDITLYSLDCHNTGGGQMANMIDIILTSDAVAPVVSFSSDVYVVKKNDPIRLTWNTNATSCQTYADVLKGGKYEWDQNHEWAADAKIRKTSGEQTLYPLATTKYHLNCFIKEKQTMRTVVVTVDGNKAPFDGPGISLSKAKIFDQGDPTVQYVTYDYGNTPADGSLYQMLAVTKKTTGNVVSSKRIFGEKGGPPSGQTTIIGLEPKASYQYELTLVDPSDGRMAQQTGEFTTGGVPLKKESPEQEVQKKDAEKVLDKRDQQTRDIEQKAKLLVENQLETVLSELQELRNKVKEQESELKYLRKISADVKELREEMQEALTTFVTYGVDINTKDLGAGERAAVVRSYQAAYGKLPDSDKELEDMIRIANGRFPSERNGAAEKRANTEFKRIYKRVANLKKDTDRAAIMVMAYGLRQAAENRNLTSESRGVATFKAIYGRVPRQTEDWNIMQAITYSGAGREKDTDEDLLSDGDEKDYGTDPFNPDTDSDGYVDGLEIESGYSPIGEGRI